MIALSGTNERVRKDGPMTMSGGGGGWASGVYASGILGGSDGAMMAMAPEAMVAAGLAMAGGRRRRRS